MKDPDHPAPLANLSLFLRTAQRLVGREGEVGVRIVSNAEMRRLNRAFRGKDEPTDVLSFPMSHNGNGRSAGDIAISSAIARANAKALGHSLENEMKILLLHGLLHLAGHDHESDNGEMERLEQELRAKLRLPVGLIERTISRVQSGVLGGNPLLQQGEAGLQSSGKARALKRGASATEGTPALKRKTKWNSFSGALKRSSPLINERDSLRARIGTAKAVPSQNRATHSRNKAAPSQNQTIHSRNSAARAQDKAHSPNARRTS